MTDTTPLASASRRRDRGATLPIVAILLPVLLLMTAFAVDLGRQRSSRRTMQARADIIALDMVRIIGGRTAVQIKADPSTTAQLASSAARNAVDVAKLAIEWGTWNGTAFVACTAVVPTCKPNAAEVTARETTDYFFQPGSGNAVRTAVATTGSAATIKLGSFAARIQSGSSPLLSQVVGDSLNTSVVGYQGLLASNIDLGLLSAALNLGSPEAVLGTDITLAKLYRASADALRNDPNSDATDFVSASLFDALATSQSGTGSVQLGKIVGVASGSQSGALAGTVNAFDLLSGSALVANGSNALAVPALTLNAGLLQVGTPCNENPGDDATEVCSALSVIQAPVTFHGPVGTSRTTSQVRTRLGTTGGIPGLAGAATQLDLSLASGTATIAGLSCGVPRTITIGVATGLADAGVRVTGKISVPTLLFGTISVPVTIALDRAPSLASEFPVFTEQADGTFSPSYYEAGTQDLGLSGVTPSVTLDLTGLGSLVKNAVNLAAGAVLAPILSTVSGPVLSSLSAATTPLLHQLGLNLAGADVSALAADCDLPRLVH